MSIVLSQKSGKTLVFIREIMEKSGNLFSENGSDPCRIVPKSEKGGTLWDLFTYILLQIIKKVEGGLFDAIKKISCLIVPKLPKNSLIVPKKSKLRPPR